MNHRLVGYHEGTSFLHRLSGASKLLFLLFVSLAAMLSYDTRLLLGIGLGALALFLLTTRDQQKQDAPLRSRRIPPSMSRLE